MRKLENERFGYVFRGRTIPNKDKEPAGTVLCVERNEARLHGEDCAEAQTQKTVSVVFRASGRHELECRREAG